MKSDYEQLKENYEKLLEKSNLLLLENFELRQKIDFYDKKWEKAPILEKILFAQITYFLYSLIADQFHLTVDINFTVLNQD